MKLTKARLRQIIKEEINSTVRENFSDLFARADRDEVAPDPYERLVDGVGSLIRIALEEDGLDPGIIRDAIKEAVTVHVHATRDPLL